MILLIVILDIIAGIIGAGILIHWDPDEWSDIYGVAFLGMCLAWPIALVGLVGYLIIHEVGKLSLLVAGFLNGVKTGKDTEKEGEKTYDYTTTG